jgi:hypothetical protein
MSIGGIFLLSEIFFTLESRDIFALWRSPQWLAHPNMGCSVPKTLHNRLSHPFLMEKAAMESPSFI